MESSKVDEPLHSSPASSGSLEFHGGLAGALLPLAVFLAGIVFVTVSGMITIRAYLGPLVLIMGLTIFLAKDRLAACEAMLSGVADRTLAVMILAFVGAGVLGQILVTGGVIQAVVWLGSLAGLQGTAFVLLAFLVSALVATATGTATGTCVTCVPVLYPGGVALGAHPGLLLGAIYSGARLGDNLAPISDTTVASAMTQGARIGEVVRTRLKYALTAGGAAALLYAVLGSVVGDGSYPMQGDMGLPIREYARPEALILLLSPALTIVLCIRGRSLVHAIWYGILSATLLGLLSGSLSPSDLYSTRPPNQVGGALTTGLIGMTDVAFLAILVMALLGPLRAAGVLEAVLAAVRRLATTPRRAELSIFLLVTAICPLTAANTPAMLLCGPLVKDLGETFRIHPTRRANLMDLAGNGVTETLPHINTMLALAGAMIASSETTGAPLIPIPLVGVLSLHPQMLTLVGLVSIGTGWGARKG